MKSNTYLIVRFIAALLTILAIAGQGYIPQKHLLIHPSPSTNISIDGYIDPIHGESAQWVDQDNYSWECNIHADAGVSIQGCGASLSWGADFTYEKPSTSPNVTCEDPLSDEDGDGWGWENERSCMVVTTPDLGKLKPSIHDKVSQVPTCQHASSDEDGDGWGWENEQSCKVTSESFVEIPTPKIPCINIQSDIDGDGIGLEYGQPCKIIQDISTIPRCGKLVAFSLESQWGWENEEICNNNNPAKRADAIKQRSDQSRLDSDNRFHGIDFSAYENIELTIHYEGRATHLRVYLRNSNPEYTQVNNHDSAKFMALSVLSEDLTTGTLQAKLSTFSVAQWWSLTYPLPRRLTGPELTNITSMGVDHISAGLHKVRLDKIELTGQWLPMERLLLIIAIFWAIYLVIETFARYYSLQKNSQLSGEEIDHLKNRTLKLEAEKNQFQELSITDALTGILNRTGIMQSSESLFHGSTKNNLLGLMILDIDHFKYVNDTYGHDTGDKILICVTSLIAANIREADIFGRWGGEEFVLICPYTNSEHLQTLAEKLRLAVKQHPFEPHHNIEITISIGATNVYTDESFNQAFKRADIALYTAKNERNKVSYQS